MVPASYWEGCELHRYRCRRGAGLASIPKAGLPDASAAIKGLHVCTIVPQSSCLSPRKNVCEVICGLWPLGQRRLRYNF